jgi:hypothetical protein
VTDSYCNVAILWNLRKENMNRQSFTHKKDPPYKFVFYKGFEYGKPFFSFIHMCIHCLGHFSPMTSPLTLLTSRQNLFCPLLQFCWREDINNNKKGIAFLLVWDKDGYTERFLVLLPCTCVLQPELIRPLHYFLVTFP